MKIKILAILLSSLFACTNREEKPLEVHSRRDALIEATSNWFKTFNSRNLEKIRQSYADSAILIDPEHLTPLKGSAEIIKTYAQLFEYVPDVKDSIVNMVADQDRVAVEFVASGNGPDGPFQMRIMTMFQFDSDNRIVRDATYYDRRQ